MITTIVTYGLIMLGIIFLYFLISFFDQKYNLPLTKIVTLVLICLIVSRIFSGASTTDRYVSAIPVSLNETSSEANFIVNVRNTQTSHEIVQYHVRGGKDYFILPPEGPGTYTITIFDAQSSEEVTSFSVNMSYEVTEEIWMNCHNYPNAALVDFRTCEQGLKEIYDAFSDSLYVIRVSNICDYFSEFTILGDSDPSVLFRDVADTIETKSGTEFQIASAMAATFRSAGKPAMVVTCRGDFGNHHYVLLSINGIWTACDPIRGLVGVNTDNIIAVY